MKKSTREAAPKTGGKKKQNKVLYYVILVILLGILVFSISKIVSYFKQQADAENIQDQVITDHITPGDTEATIPVTPDDNGEDDGEERN